jgi:membrane-associated protease RseP (regulator of RpoE activity)
LLGGYVVAGMIDESMIKNLNNEPPWEFRSKPVYQRMIVITGGVIMNTLLAFLIFYTLALWANQNGNHHCWWKSHEKTEFSSTMILSINGNRSVLMRSVLIFLSKHGEDFDIKFDRTGDQRCIYSKIRNADE